MLNAQMALLGTAAYRNTAALVAGFADAMFDGFVGVLTGTITSPSQLSALAFDRGLAVISGTGDWEVYDADAHPTYPGTAVVLRKACTNAPSMYKYMFLWIYGGTSGSSTIYCNVSGLIGFMGGWDSTAKAPTTLMPLSTGATLGAGASITTVAVPYAGTSAAAAGVANSVLLAGNVAVSATPSVGTPCFQLLDGGDTFAYYPYGSSGGTSTYFPLGLLAEYAPASGWANPANGCAPFFSAQNNSTANPCTPYAPHTRDTAGSVVTPATTRVMSALALAPASFTGAALGLGGAAYLIDKYLTLDDGSTAIPLAPLEVSVTAAPSGNITYLGRASGLFATHCGLAIGDGFSDGTHSYVVVSPGPTVALLAGSFAPAHSPSARLALRMS